MCWQVAAFRELLFTFKIYTKLVHLPAQPHLEVTEEVLEGGGVRNDGGLVAAVNCSHQREGEMENVAVEQ